MACIKKKKRSCSVALKTTLFVLKDIFFQTLVQTITIYLQIRLSGLFQASPFYCAFNQSDSHRLQNCQQSDAKGLSIF